MVRTMQLTEPQDQAIAQIVAWIKQRATAQRPRVFALRGLAGTGKTTIIAEMINAGLLPAGAVVVAPTGRAAAVLGRKGLAASTIHAAIYRAIETSTGTRWALRSRLGDEPRPFVVVDEASMVNRQTLDDLLAAFDRVLLVGDHGQLPPIEGESVLLQAEGVTLREIMRQALDSGIIRTAHCLRRGDDIDRALAEGGEDVLRRLPEEGEIDGEGAGWDMSAATLITARNADRVVLNLRCRASILGEQGEPLVVGDRLVALANQPTGWNNGTVADVTELGRTYEVGGEVFRCFRALCDDGLEREGEIWIAQIDQSKRPEDRLWSLWQEFQEARMNGHPRTRLYQRGWCLTAHKSQGSEWASVIVYGDGFGSMSDRAAWRYTAATRAMSRLYWIGV